MKKWLFFDNCGNSVGVEFPSKHKALQSLKNVYSIDKIKENELSLCFVEIENHCWTYCYEELSNNDLINELI